jgi:hypothetical protein
LFAGISFLLQDLLLVASLYFGTAVVCGVVVACIRFCRSKEPAPYVVLDIYQISIHQRQHKKWEKAQK